MDLVWECMLDDKYRCLVKRCGLYRGSLEMWEGSKLHKELPVGLAYNAQFGPDVTDVRQWEDQCIAWVDRLTKDS